MNDRMLARIFVVAVAVVAVPAFAATSIPSAPYTNRSAFEEANTDPTQDGTLSRAELIRAADLDFAHVNANADHTISLAELKAENRSNLIAPVPTRELTRQAFREANDDRDDTLSPLEYERFIARAYDRCADPPTGKLTFEQFARCRS